MSYFLQIFIFSYISPYLAYLGLKVSRNAQRFGGHIPTFGECDAYFERRKIIKYNFILIFQDHNNLPILLDQLGFEKTEKRGKTP